MGLAVQSRWRLSKGSKKLLDALRQRVILKGLVSDDANQQQNKLKRYLKMTTARFDVDSTVDFLFASEDDVQFVQRFTEVTSGASGATDEDTIRIHRSSRDGVSVYARLRDALLSGVKVEVKTEGVRVYRE
jgi:hypothetical protein